ncbi:MAG: GGDEF domain-containing protein [Castellaniella sp.]
MVHSGQSDTASADQTLKEALRAQLHLLHVFFPLSCWMVLARHGEQHAIVISHVAPGASCLPLDVAALAGDGWRAWPHAAGFEYLPAAEPDALAGPRGQVLLRHALHDMSNGSSVFLLGQISQRGLERVCAAGHPAPDLGQVFNALIHSLRLYDELVQLTARLSELKRNAFTEPLTGVLNRAGWMNRLDHLEGLLARSGEDVAIIVLDLDMLKLVNDTHGHCAGDELLQLTAHTIRSTLRLGDIVGRLGGDEFGVAVQCAAPALAPLLVTRLQNALSEVGVEVSIGLSLRSEAGSLEQAVTLADKRMYEHKRAKPAPRRAMNWRRGAVPATRCP